MGRKALSAFAKAKKRNKSEEATLPSALLDEIGPSDIAVSGPTSTWTSQVERKLLCGGHGGGDHACAPAPDLATAHGFVADELRGPMESGAMGDASTEGDGVGRDGRCKYTRMLIVQVLDTSEGRSQTP